VLTARLGGEFLGFITLFFLLLVFENVHNKSSLYKFEAQEILPWIILGS
jgi:hypothetical protein